MLLFFFVGVGVGVGVAAGPTYHNNTGAEDLRGGQGRMSCR